LADLQVYYTNLRGFHWNIKGKNFYVLHKQFEDMYNDAAEKVDEVAERLLMLGETPQHNFSDYLKVSQIKESGLVTDGDQAMKNILETYKYLIHLERQISADAAEIGAAEGPGSGAELAGRDTAGPDCHSAGAAGGRQPEGRAGDHLIRLVLLS